VRLYIVPVGMVEVGFCWNSSFCSFFLQLNDATRLTNKLENYLQVCRVDDRQLEIWIGLSRRKLAASFINAAALMADHKTSLLSRCKRVFLRGETIQPQRSRRIVARYVVYCPGCNIS
jgi:hypothetical protein